MCILYSFPNTSSELLICISLQKNVYLFWFSTQWIWIHFTFSSSLMLVFKVKEKCYNYI